MFADDAVADDLQLVKIAKALADPMRFRILRAISGTEELSCSDIVRRFPISQATVSHHVRVLAESGLVNMRRRGQFSYLSAVPGRLAWYRRRLKQLLGWSRVSSWRAGRDRSRSRA